MYEENKLYIGNLNFTATDDELRQCFEEKGIKVKTVDVIKDRYTGKSRGFGFIVLENEGDTEKAIELVNGADLKGRKLIVNKARTQKGNRSERGGGYQSRD